MPDTSANTTAKVNTKLERLVDAIEGLALTSSATVSGNTRIIREMLHKEPREEVTDEDAMQHVEDVREELREALKEFLQPLLNLANGPRQEQPSNIVPLEDKVRCARCRQYTICENTNCSHWHRAIRNKRAEVLASQAESLPHGDDAA